MVVIITILWQEICLWDEIHVRNVCYPDLMWAT